MYMKVDRWFTHYIIPLLKYYFILLKDNLNPTGKSDRLEIHVGMISPMCALRPLNIPRTQNT